MMTDFGSAPAISDLYVSDDTHSYPESQQGTVVDAGSEEAEQIEVPWLPSYADLQISLVDPKALFQGAQHKALEAEQAQQQQ
jgi:hypothetical protein